ncbi:hypothetical protein PMI09_00586 [Rhizobium sp. CF122]|nr:hypothetical protein PMI09_00586 [Rhizobium sp. CF122]
MRMVATAFAAIWRRVAVRFTAIGIMLCVAAWLFVLWICLCLMPFWIRRPASRAERLSVRPQST